MATPQAIAGSVVRAVGSFTDLGDAAVDPDVVVVCYTNGDADPVNFIYGTDAEVVKDEVGTYHVDIDTTGFAVVASGTSTLTVEWACKATTTGHVQVVGSEKLRIVPAPIVPAFV